MASPSRPVLRRQNSKVRFTRTDMSPVGTMASESTIHGVHHQHHRQSRDDPQREHEDEQELYDVNSYPFSSEVSRDVPPSDDHGAYHRGVPGEEDVELHPLEEQVQRYEDYDEPTRATDGYTSTPPRVGARRWTNSQQHRPSLDTLLSAEAVEHFRSPNRNDMSVSPRNSTVVGNYDVPSAHPVQNRSPYQGSPQSRPPSALRASLVIPSNAPGSPQHALGYEAVVERLDYPRGSPTRSSMPALGATPPRRVFEQHRVSVPTESPVIGSPQFGHPAKTRGSHPAQMASIVLKLIDDTTNLTVQATDSRLFHRTNHHKAAVLSRQMIGLEAANTLEVDMIAM